MWQAASKVVPNTPCFPVSVSLSVIPVPWVWLYLVTCFYKYSKSDGLSLFRLGYKKVLASILACPLSCALKKTISHFVSFPVELTWQKSSTGTWSQQPLKTWWLPVAVCMSLDCKQTLSPSSPEVTEALADSLQPCERPWARFPQLSHTHKIPDHRNWDNTFVLRCYIWGYLLGINWELTQDVTL